MFAAPLRSTPAQYVIVAAASGGMELLRSTTVQEIVNGPRLYGSYRHMTVPEMKAIGDATRQHAVQYGVDSSRYNVHQNFQLWRVIRGVG